MLQIQQNYLSVLTDAKNEAGKTQLLQGYLKNLDDLSKEISAQELLVPVIGGFSAGKSSLLNEFLGEGIILNISISPETSIATELRHSKEPKIEAVKDDGSVKKFKIDELKTFGEKAQDYNHIKLFLDNKKLKDIEPLILVDMPGFRSPTATHNKAIDRYMPMGVYFIALLAAKDEGTITASFLSDLSDINERGKKFALCLSKTDLLTESNAQEVADNVKIQLSTFDLEDEIYLLGRENSGEVLKQILSKIDKEDIFARIFEARIKASLNEMIASIDETIKGLKFDKEEARRYLEELDESIKNIENEEKRILNESEGRCANAEIQILEALRDKLEANASELASLLMNANKSAFSQRVENIVKSTLEIELEKHFKEVSSELIDNFTSQVKNIEINADTKNWADDLKGTLAGLSVGGALGALRFLVPIGGPIATAITLIVSTLIGGLVKWLFGGKSEEAKKEELKVKVVDEILNQVQPKLYEILKEQDAELTQALSAKFKEKMQEKQQEIKAAQEEKEAKINEIEGEIKELELVKENIINIGESVL